MWGAKELKELGESEVKETRVRSKFVFYSVGNKT